MVTLAEAKGLYEKELACYKALTDVMKDPEAGRILITKELIDKLPEMMKLYTDGVKGLIKFDKVTAWTPSDKIQVDSQEVWLLVFLLYKRL